MKGREPLLGGVGLGAFALLGEIVGRLPSSPVAPTSHVFAEAIAYLGAREFWAATRDTLLQWGAAMALVILIAVPLGIVIGRIRVLREATASTISLLAGVPAIVLIPVFVVSMGSQLRMVVTLTTLATVWSVLIPTIEAAKHIDQVALDTARLMRLSPARRFISVELPATLPAIATGIRIASVVALLVVVATELIAGSPGLGQLMIRAQETRGSAKLFALCAITGVLGLIVNAVLQRSERLYVWWVPRQLPAGERVAQ